MMGSIPVRVENIMGKGENTVYHHSFLYVQHISKVSPSGSIKLAIMWGNRLTLIKWQNFRLVQIERISR